MVVTPFGEFRLGDANAEYYWLQAHKRRHGTEVQLTGTAGGILDGPIDGDWFYRHWARHVALATFQGISLGSANTKALALPGYWKNEQELTDWHDLHNRIHLLQDRQLNL
jgi:hypothetical protein